MDPLLIVEKAGPYAPLLVYVWIVVAVIFAYLRTKRTSGLYFLLAGVWGLLYVGFARLGTSDDGISSWALYGLYAFLPLLFVILPFLVQKGLLGKSARTRTSSDLSLLDMLLFRPHAADMPEALGASKSTGREAVLVSIVIVALDLIGLGGEGLQPCRWLDLALEHSGCIVEISYGGSVQALAFSPDGSLLVVGGSEYTADLRRVSDGQLVRTFAGHNNWVSAAAFSPDGSLLATASWDNSVQLWRVSDGALIRKMQVVAPKDVLVSIAYSSDGRTIAAGTGWGANDYAIWLWNVADGSVLRTIHSGGYEVAFSPDSATLATVAPGGGVILSRVSDGTTLFTVGAEGAGHINSGGYMAFSPDGNTLIYRGDTALYFVRVNDGKVARTLQLSDLAGLLALSSDRSLVAYLPRDSRDPFGDNGRMVIRQVQDGREVGSLLVGRAFILACLHAYLWLSRPEVPRSSSRGSGHARTQPELQTRGRLACHLNR